MSIEIKVLNTQRAVLIDIDGAIDAAQTIQMRRDCVNLTKNTGLTDFVVDMRRVTSIENGEATAIVDLGNNFKEHNFTVWSNTAVLMPLDERAYEQAELMHTIEVNRGRGVLNYVESMEEAFSWFEEMGQRVQAS